MAPATLLELIMKMLRLFFLLAFALICGNIMAQSHQRCHTVETREVHRVDDPAYTQEEQRLQGQYEHWIFSGGPLEKRGGIRTIPVVVHLIQSTATPTITPARVQTQIDVMNEDYRRMNADTSNTRATFTSVTAAVSSAFDMLLVQLVGCYRCR